VSIDGGGPWRHPPLLIPANWPDLVTEASERRESDWERCRDAGGSAGRCAPAVAVVAEVAPLTRCPLPFGH
jgi:hypothetical protein